MSEVTMVERVRALQPSGEWALSDIEVWRSIVFGVLAIWLAYSFWPAVRRRWLAARASVPAAGTPAPGESTLATKLHKLDTAYGEFAQEAVHTNELMTNADFRAAVALLADTKVPVDTVLDYAFGINWRLSCVAFEALKQRPDGSEAARVVAGRFNQFSLWQMTFALEFLAAKGGDVLPSAVLAGFQDWWSNDTRLHNTLAQHFKSLGPEAPAEIDASVRALPDHTQDRVKGLIVRVPGELARRIAAELGAPAPNEPAKTPTASKFLTELGRFWDQESNPHVTIEPACWSEDLVEAEADFDVTPLRSLLLSAEPLSGKTAFLRLLQEKIAKRGWRVFEASGADLQAGQIYIGELEGRIRRAIEELSSSRKLIWYVPDLMQLAQSGTHSGQSATILDQILPAMTSGQLVIWAEATPKSMVRLMQMRPALRRSLTIVRLDPMPMQDVEMLAESLSARLALARGLSVTPQLAATAVEAAQHYLGASGLPGSALALIRLTVSRSQAAKGATLTGADLLETLSQLTGLPMAILDGSERLDLAAIRKFFGERVIGQPEAVEAIVDRVAMLKSGLNDPGKPIGVFLFAGPTGTGKTELAKAVAEYLFGSVERMIRLDMSEYQSPDTVAKLIGGGGLARDTDTLISRVRKQPFSLVLLDEFEKASPYVWDIFLQVFDEGRLTDAFGDPADFRHCLIILTTNLGATSHQSSGLGFAPTRTAYSVDQIMKAVAQTFRPEFQNRLDRVIVFQPLTRELMRGILKKELGRIFERRGLKDRAWAVEWEASALEFLLEKGFSPDMGARPLKRAIDQYVVTPLAATIVERRFPAGDQFVFVRSDGDAIVADFVDPDDDLTGGAAGSSFLDDKAGAAAPTLAEMIRAPAGSRVEIAALTAAAAPVAERLAAPDWEQQKRKLAAEMNTPEFWHSSARFDTLGRLELMDRLEVAAETARSMLGRMARRTDGAGHTAHELVSRLALQLYLLEAGLRDLDEGAPDEAVMLVEPAFDAGGEVRQPAEAWRREVLGMYEAWAKKRNMKTELIGDAPGANGPLLLAGGFGAWRTLSREAGLHVLEAADGSSGRVAVRVVLAAVAVASAGRTQRNRALAETLAQTPRGSGVVRRYRRLPSPLVRNADGSWRSGKVEEVLAGDFDLLAEAAA